MDRWWLLTWTTYGSWLPGDPRGSVARVRAGGASPRRANNVPGTPTEPALPELEGAARLARAAPPVWLTRDHATVLAAQFEETAGIRGWQLLAVAVMTDHVHLVVAVPGDPQPDLLLRDFKSYGSRALNRRFARPASGRWWTHSGSRRVLVGEPAVRAAVEYVRSQAEPLLIRTLPW